MPSPDPDPSWHGSQTRHDCLCPPLEERRHSCCLLGSGTLEIWKRKIQRWRWKQASEIYFRHLTWWYKGQVLFFGVNKTNWYKKAGIFLCVTLKPCYSHRSWLTAWAAFQCCCPISIKVMPPVVLPRFVRFQLGSKCIVKCIVSFFQISSSSMRATG